jgi:hypothetical protein
MPEILGSEDAAGEGTASRIFETAGIVRADAEVAGADHPPDRDP